LTKIELRLYGDLLGYINEVKIGEAKIMEVDEGFTIGDLMKDLNMPRDIVKIILVNGRSKGLEYKLNANDRVALFPPVAGG